MADDTKNTTPERRVSLTITLFENSLSQTDAQALEDAIRDVADQFGANVTASRGNPINTPS